MPSSLYSGPAGSQLRGSIDPAIQFHLALIIGQPWRHCAGGGNEGEMSFGLILTFGVRSGTIGERQCSATGGVLIVLGRDRLAAVTAAFAAQDLPDLDLVRPQQAQQIGRRHAPYAHGTTNPAQAKSRFSGGREDPDENDGFILIGR
jgi:hypothetical protein